MPIFIFTKERRIYDKTKRLDGERDTEFGIKEADYGNRVLCTSREDAEKYIEKTKLILEIHSRGLREKDFSLSQLHELQNYLERTEK